MKAFRAYRIHESGKFGEGCFGTMSRGKAKIALKFPLVAGIDLAGTVEESADARFKSGDEVIVHSFGLGADHDGGYAEFGRFPAEWVIPLPKGLTLFEASALGVAGHTAALAVDLISDLRPRHLDRIARRIRFQDLESAFDELLAARAVGRQVVDFSLG